MPHDHFDSAPAGQMLRQTLREINRAVLPARATERDSQAREPPTLICVDAGIHQRDSVGQKLMRAFLLVKIFDHHRVFACKSLEPLFASRVGYAAGIENEAAAVPGLVLRYPPGKRKTEDSHNQMLFLGSQVLQFFG